MAEQVAAAYPDVVVAVRAQRAFLARAVHFADLRATAAIVDRAAGVLDFGQPVAVTLLGILQGIPDQEHPGAIVARLMDAVPQGSYLAISQIARR